MITTENLTKRFGRVEAVRGVSLDVREGDRYGLLGPVVRSADPAALNARLVAADVPVRSLVAQRRSLEEIVLDVTGAGSDQFSVDSGRPGVEEEAP